MTRWMHENSDKRHRCPKCHTVMPYRYKPIRHWLYDKTFVVHLFLRYRLPRPLRWMDHLWPSHWDSRLPRRCRYYQCDGDVVVLPAWIAWIFGIKEEW